MCYSKYKVSLKMTNCFFIPETTRVGAYEQTIHAIKAKLKFTSKESHAQLVYLQFNELGILTILLIIQVNLYSFPRD